ncbi:aspartyl/glutamyl-tRNA amidotransferase subunit A [Candidatus Woesearchaeota archaeon]|nr:aspartyl/glutamyl-tRNA amidotransferase subunit A [Candidatus Woesearchaeota archaeon]
MISDFVKSVQQGKIDPVHHIRSALEEVKNINQQFHYCTTIPEQSALAESKEAKTGRLAGVAVSVKDCICVKDIESTAGSAILKGYHPVMDATAVQRLKDEGAIIIAKTAQDEFGFGSFAVNVGIGMEIPKNPVDPERACGGSSGGSAGLTRKVSFPHVSLAESTGGSIVCPASFCGVYGLCPTYGVVSRYGLMDYANSLDKIGPMATSVDDLKLVMDIIGHMDPRDSTCTGPQHAKVIQKPRIGLLKSSFAQGVDPKVQSAVREFVEKLKRSGFSVSEVELPLTEKYGISCYYLISMCEASTNLAKFCGMRYGAHEPLDGNFNEYFSKVRSKYFNEESKRRIIIGTFARMAGYRDAYYLKAMRVRTKIIEEYKKIFTSVDILLSPTMPILPPRFADIGNLSPLQQYMMDIMTVGPNLAGLPHLNIPAGSVEGLPVGMLLIADHYQEQTLLACAKVLE